MWNRNDAQMTKHCADRMGKVGKDLETLMLLHGDATK